MTAAAPVKLAITTGGVSFRNPIVTASGTFGYGKEFEKLTDLGAIGGLVTKGISPEPRFGNATPRICETASGMLNSIGLENVGVEGFARDKLPYLRTCGTRVLVNFFGVTFDEYIDCGERLARLDGVDALEMNVSCPNIKAGGIEFGTDPRVLRRSGAAVPRGDQEAALDQAHAQHLRHRRAGARRAPTTAPTPCRSSTPSPEWRSTRGRGGPRSRPSSAACPGPAIKPIALRMVYQVRRAGVPLPISGIGGIQDATDAIEFFLAGASTVQVGTQSFVDPDASGRIVRDLERVCGLTASATCAS